MTTPTVNRENDVKHLNSFLKNELSAVETYNQCLKNVDDTQVASGLSELQNSHQQRAVVIRQKIRELGGDPEESSGMWGSVAKIVEGGARLFGDNSAISALEEGEDRGRDQYLKKSDNLSPGIRSFVNAELIPEQRRTHDMLNRIQDLVH